MKLRIPIFRCAVVRGGVAQSPTIYIMAQDQESADKEASFRLGASLRDLEVVKL